ncbi:MAG: hypothetical protein Kow00128_04720 [Deltaproteobacteria bacterium]
MPWIYLCCLSAGVVAFLLTENRRLWVRIGLGAAVFLGVSLAVTRMMIH